MIDGNGARSGREDDSNSDNSGPAERSRESLVRDLDQQDTQIPAPGSGATRLPGSDDSQDDSRDAAAKWDGYLSDASEEDVSPVRLTDWSGRTVGSEGRYEIQKLLGRGGMGKVYLASDRNRNDSSVAIKVPFEYFLDTPGLRERFEREFKAMIDLEHPHVCRVIDTGRFHDVPFVVMQNLSGGNLRERSLQSQPGASERSPEDMFEWLKAIAEALDFVHSRGYLHRDVKPENILFDEHGNAYLSDFGIVRALDDAPKSKSDSTLTRPGECVGTLGYVAPELLKGERDNVDGRADLYALAAVAYLYLTGKPPFDGDTNDMIRLAQLTETPSPAHEVNASVPAAASAVLDRALAREPERRQPTCGDFAEALATAYGLGQSGPISKTQPESAATRSSRSNVLTFLLVTVAIALVAARFPWPVDPPPPPPPQEPDEHLANALKYEETGDFDDSVDEINSVPEDEKTAEHFAARGRAFFGDGDEEEGIADMTRAIELEPQAIYYNERSHMFIALGAPTKAIEDLTEAIKLAADEPRHYADRAVCYLQLEEYQSAIDDYTAAIEHKAELTDADELGAWHNGRGTARTLLYRETGSNDRSLLEAALEDSNQAIEAQPGEAKHYQNRAVLYRILGQEERSRDDIERANELESGS